MENNPDELLILTIVIRMHSRVTNFDLNTREYNIFNNVRLLCKAGGFNDYDTSPIEELTFVSNLQKSFTKDLNEPTYNILKEHSGVLVDNITYDKVLSVIEGQYETLFDFITPFKYIQGIYLLSIHKGKKLIYPGEDKKIINFLKLSDLHILANLFKTKVPNIKDESTVIPDKKIFTKEENDVTNDDSLTEEIKNEKIKNIRGMFYNHIYNFQLTIEGNNIVIIKLSKLVELIKVIIGEPCFINILDYSCNTPSSYIPDKRGKRVENVLHSDIEMGIKRNPLLGGKNKYKKRKIKKRKTKRKKTRKKSTRKI